MLKKIIYAAGIIGIVFFAFFCGKGCKETIIQNPDTSGAIIQHQQSIIKKDSILILSLNDSLGKYRDRIRKDKELNLILQGQLQSALIHIKEIPLDSSVILMAENFQDKQEIKLQISESDTTAGIHPKQITEVNESFLMNEFYTNSWMIILDQMAEYEKMDSTNQIIIDNYKEMLKGKDTIADQYQKENSNLKIDLKDQEKKTRWQRIQKYIWKGIAGAAIIYGIIK